MSLMTDEVEMIEVQRAEEDLQRPFISELQIRLRTAQLAELVARELDVKGLVVIVVLKGAFIFAADLTRRLYDQGITPELDFIRAASYGAGDKSSGTVETTLDVSTDLKNRPVLLVDDIVDSGRTLAHIKQHLLNLGAKTVKSCVLLDKPSRREIEFEADWVGFKIPDIFVVGYGMDHAERYRYLPYITFIQRADSKSEPDD